MTYEIIYTLLQSRLKIAHRNRGHDVVICQACQTQRTDSNALNLAYPARSSNNPICGPPSQKQVRNTPAITLPRAPGRPPSPRASLLNNHAFWKLTFAILQKRMNDINASH